MEQRWELPVMDTVTDMATGMATDMAMAMAITATMGKKDEEKENKLSVVIKKSLSDRSGYRINHYFVSDGITYKI
jgi:hypothetical protein